MTNNDVTTVIDTKKCVGCGKCVEVCPARTLSMKEGKAAVTGSRSIQCGHCEAICPVGAIRVEALDPEAFRFATVKVDERWLPPGESDLAALLRLMRSRRSVRSFNAKPVERSLLEDLVRAGTAAPTGTNSQCWAFTVFPTRESVAKLGEVVAAFFKTLNTLASIGALRGIMKLFGKPELDTYNKRYRETIQWALDEWTQFKRDRLFHQAPAVIIVSGRPGGSTTAEDALLATQNIMLAAHAMGLGTCLIGFAVAAMRRDRGLQRQFGIGNDETVFAVIAVGYSDRRFERCAGRRKTVVRWV